MLADDVISSEEFRALGKGRDRLIGAIREAHRFVVEKDLAAGADDLRVSKPTAFARILPLLRLPFETTWIEVCHQDRPIFSTDFERVDGLSEGVSRVGVLIRERAPLQWLVHLFWKFQNGRVTASVMATDLDLRAEGPRQDGSPRSVHPSYRGLPDPEIEAVRWLERSGELMPSLFHVEALHEISRHPKGKATLAELGRLAAADWSAEIPFWMAVVALLNSRNVVAIEEQTPPEKLNRARVKKGALPLLGYSTCAIAGRLKRRIADDERRVGEALGGMRAHFVRGHFKVRRGGVFWWSPFIRGDTAAGFVSKDYRLVGNAEDVR